MWKAGFHYVAHVIVVLSAAEDSEKPQGEGGGPGLFSIKSYKMLLLPTTNVKIIKGEKPQSTWTCP